jgi:hypothetical protein
VPSRACLPSAHTCGCTPAMPCTAMPCPALHCVQDAVGPAFHSLRRVTAHFRAFLVRSGREFFRNQSQRQSAFPLHPKAKADAFSLWRAGLIPKFRCSRRAGGSTRFGASLSAVRYHCSVPTVHVQHQCSAAQYHRVPTHYCRRPSGPRWRRGRAKLQQMDNRSETPLDCTVALLSVCCHRSDVFALRS